MTNELTNEQIAIREQILQGIERGDFNPSRKKLKAEDAILFISATLSAINFFMILQLL